ncbi:MAG: sigma-70 family RNA polymerase sigma factor [Planctomycetota bacterium]|nr:sigma-70 family RNA polymerase sigma factor [Planctomycetota bacterium]
MVAIMLGAAHVSDEVVARAAGGSREDLHRLLEALEGQVRLMVAARLSPTRAQYEAAEDLVQQALTAVTEGIGRLEIRTGAGLRAFTSKIVAHKVSDYLQGKGASPRGGPPLRSLDRTIGSTSQSGPLWQFLSVSMASPATAAERAEQAARVVEELSSLKQEQREVLILAYFDGLSTAEIGQRLGLSRNAASMLLLRATRALRRRMKTPTSVG